MDLNWTEWIQQTAAVATAVAVTLAWWQLRLTKRQAVVQFEDSMAREYRDIAHSLPTAALLGEALSDPDHVNALGDFYRYVDLTNSQVFLRSKGRISTPTWSDWVEGIRTLLAKPAFARAWTEIKVRAPDSFSELRRLEKDKFASDPRGWK